jgi:hypothetical protein
MVKAEVVALRIDRLMTMKAEAAYHRTATACHRKVVEVVSLMCLTTRICSRR